uniref:Uncharacterized protein n=1 Tax=viral metagenome TaxID=1070528 RepID=A0A6M3JPX2_9ZZZZ
MTITYTLTHHEVVGNRRKTRGAVTRTSGEGTVYINPGLRVCYSFDILENVSGSWVVTYPTSFPEIVSDSGFITVLYTSGNNTIYWEATGKA